MDTKKKVEFEQQMFDIITTQNPAAAALNCMGIAEAYHLIKEKENPFEKMLEDKHKLLTKTEEQKQELLNTMKEISKGEGAYALDRLTHANNTIESMKELAVQALIKNAE